MQIKLNYVSLFSFHYTKHSNFKFIPVFDLQVIAYNQNVEKLETLGKKLNKKVEDLLQSKEELTEDLIKIIEVHSQAVKTHQKINENHGNDNQDSF